MRSCVLTNVLTMTLVVAIPASAGYNYFTSNNGQNEISYYNFGSQVLSLFKRGDLLALEEVAG